MKPRFFIILTIIAACSAKNDTAKDAAVNDADTTAQVAKKEGESEEEELARRHSEDEKVFSEMNVYDGTYKLYTESEGAAGTLVLQYLGDKTLKFSLRLSVADVCEGIIEDTAYIDRTQHAFLARQGCNLHFELLGQNIEISEPEGCNRMKGDCTFAGTYQAVKSE